MKLRKQKSLKAGRLRRAALALGLASGLASGMLLAVTTPAHAAQGTESGLVLTPSSGPTTTVPTWSTTVGCPSAESSSVILQAANAADTSSVSASAAANSGPPTNYNFAAAFPAAGQTALNVGAAMSTIQGFGGIANGGTQELFVQCASGPGATGTVVNAMNIFVTYSANGSTYSTSSSPPQAGTPLSPGPSRVRSTPARERSTRASSLPPRQPLARELPRAPGAAALPGLLVAIVMGVTEADAPLVT